MLGCVFLYQGYPLSIEGYFTTFQVQEETIFSKAQFCNDYKQSSGSNYPECWIYLLELVFSHRQLYVALFRGVSRSTTWMLAKPNKDVDPTGRRTKNIIFKIFYGLENRTIHTLIQVSHLIHTINLSVNIVGFP